VPRREWGQRMVALLCSGRAGTHGATGGDKQGKQYETLHVEDSWVGRKVNSGGW